MQCTRRRPCRSPWRTGITRLEQAVDAFRAALEVRTRERVPLDWTLTQVKVGNALSVLGQRENGTARLEEAVVAFRACLTAAMSVWPPPLAS